ncbi:047L [Cherax quadricarinatus iridovirus]|uniref:Patatin-like phospholipase n=1 Tax=Shrimp hemocyte iridescent virus TaxID=2039780 RepID=A0A291B0V4_9VIRU|nr:047L [Cherax quadricarinatus iridovirus]YP_010084857.1 patatin-like phospholipase [Shrimp hemocyte iridescent virus]UPA43365.1 patatin-like phospholipase [Iridovirus CN01]ASZ85027.1 047L [Cherax quadricarinatus iridovirus]ATE87114.1 patatin-like phospholipase [Shrimp hemocyte iridescent virus]UPA43441.1 patatin-like phospholipase [Iridovirus CN01]UPA43635.1 patatin-like phospholipase [Iridovirus CN01]
MDSENIQKEIENILNERKNYDTLVLSGNSTNAIITLGALQYLYEQNFLDEIQTYVGTSSGAMLCLLLNIGYEPIDLISFICTENVYKKIHKISFSNIIFESKNLITFEPIKNSLEQLIMEKMGFVPTLAELEKINSKKLVFVTYNLTDDQREYVSYKNYPDISIVDALHMSSNFPLIFEPFSYKGKNYIDGGFVDNFAIEYGEICGNKCLGVLTVNPSKKFNPEEFNKIDYVLKLIHIFINTTTQDKINKSNCDIIKLDHESNFFNFATKNLDLIKMFDLGYKICKENECWDYI